ncbi:hypothetical protein AHF37_09496 [Paragonimus kellicotti]|nr:hypothetical protein AHF37_09496 [Paragonimus kellicotti]
MVWVTQMSGGRYAVTGALTLFSLSLVFQFLTFLSSFRSDSPNWTIGVIRTRLIPSFDSQPGNLSDIPHISFNDFVAAVNSSISASQSLRIPVTTWNSTGSEDLKYPLEIDMLEVVRLTLNNLTVKVKPINQPAFELLISNKEKCQIAPDLLILIKSAPKNFLLRDTVRVGWGAEHCWGGRRVVRLFLLGRVPSSDNATSVRLSHEAAFYGDIIQQDFIDHYHNNTYKIMFGIDWAVRFCPQAPLIMFVDDDFFVYPRNVIAYIEGLSLALRSQLIAGYVWWNAAPIRNKKAGPLKKWSIGWAEYPNTQYPPYMAAGNFFLSMSMARELNVAARFTQYLRFDDVFLGIVMKKLLRTPIHLSRIYAFVPVNTNDSQQVNTMLSSHQYDNPSAQFSLWKLLGCQTFCHLVQSV